MKKRIYSREKEIEREIRKGEKDIEIAIYIKRRIVREKREIEFDGEKK